MLLLNQITSFKCVVVYAKPVIISFLASLTLFKKSTRPKTSLETCVNFILAWALALNWVRNKRYLEVLSKKQPALSLSLSLSQTILLNKHHRKDYLSGNLTVSSLSAWCPWCPVLLITGGEFELRIDLTNALRPLELRKWKTRLTGGGSSRGDAWILISESFPESGSFTTFFSVYHFHLSSPR